MAYTTINKSTDYFNTTLHTGNSSTQSITGVGFQPDLTWIKRRSADGWHWLTDAVRGTTKTIYSNATTAEETQAYGLTAFNTDGFTLGNNADINGNGQTHVAWNWLANGSGSANTDGTINSTVSANTTAGFSIVSYTGTGSNATVGHGLGVVPKMIIVKDRTTTRDWFVYHNSIGNANRLKLNDTAASGSSTVWNSTTPTSSVFSIDSQVYTNASGNNFIAYCFAEKTGYSKFGSYTGNGSTDGTFVYTGFKPAWVMVKSTSLGTEGWFMYDNTRSESNPTNDALLANLNNSEYANNATFTLDLLSNGFKLKNSDGSHNGSGQSYIYMAFGQSLVGSNNVPCTAR